MDKHVLTVKYSLFGNYDYIDAIPENVSKLYGKFGGDGFMPNMVTLLKIIQPQNTLEQTLRPQLINKQNSCVITILPERVDIEFSNGVQTDKAIDYITSIVDLFDLKINRIALNSSTGIDNLSDLEIKYFNANFTPPANYDGEDDLIEYSSKRVSRKQADCIGELINVGRNIYGITEFVDGQLSINRIKVDSDINTLSEFTQERFDIDMCRKFFEMANEINNDVINNIRVMKNEI